jgi:enamine deaminase RidA (YjgF/YER057c/UK114 family)
MNKEFITPNTLATPVGYSHIAIVQGGKIILISGQIPLNAQNQLVGKDDLAAQTQQVFENLKTALETVGATFADVLKLTYFIVNYKLEYRPVVLNIRDQYVSLENPPASTLLGVQSLALPEILIEIEAIAAVDQ